MSVPPTVSTSVTQPSILAGLTSESMLLAAQAMSSPSIASTSTISSAHQYSAETLLTAEALLAFSERPSTSLSQTTDPEMILPSKDTTVTTRPSVRLCDPNVVTLPLHSTPMERTITHETPVHFGTQYISPVSGPSPGPPIIITAPNSP